MSTDEAVRELDDCGTQQLLSSTPRKLKWLEISAGQELCLGRFVPVGECLGCRHLRAIP